MYRISKKDPDVSGVYNKNYFGPCYKEDVLSPEELKKYSNSSNYIDINMIASDPSKKEKLRNLLLSNGVGGYRSWANNFRNNNSLTLSLCRRRANSTQLEIIIFLRPEVASFLGLSNEPVIVNPWNKLDENSRKLVLENFIPEDRSKKTRYGKEVSKIRYTGSVLEILEWQQSFGDSALSLLNWSKYLEGPGKKSNRYSAYKKFSEIEDNEELSSEQKQAGYNNIIEQYYYGIQDDLFKELYRYTLDEDDPNYNPQIANLSVEHKGRTKTRSIVTDGFTLSEWKQLVFGGKIPPIVSRDLSREQKEKLLNGITEYGQRVEKQYKVKYTGNNPHTLEKMRLTGLSSNVYYSATEYYLSLAKVKYIEDKLQIKPFNVERQKAYKIPESEMPMKESYKSALSDFNLSQVENAEGLKNTIGNWFRQNAKRRGVTNSEQSLKDLIDSDADDFSIRQQLVELQNTDNLFLDFLYTKSTGSSGEQILAGTLEKALSKNNNLGLKFKRTFSVDVFPANSNESIKLIFDGVIFDKSDRIVLLFEYQGAQHYNYNRLFFKSYEDFQERLYRDKIKLDFCRQHQIPLYNISHSLDGDEAQQIYLSLFNNGMISRFIPKGTKSSYDSVRLEQDPNELENYIEDLVVTHFSPMMTLQFTPALISKIQHMVIDLSKLVMIAMSNSGKQRFTDTSFMKGYSKETLLDEGHKKIVDSFNEHFGDKYKLDYRDNVTPVGQINIPKQAPEVSEFAFHKSSPSFRKKRYKITIK
jgi:hypothetical protein